MHLRDFNLHVSAIPNSGRGNIVVGHNHTYSSCTNCLLAGEENKAEGAGHTVFGNKNSVKGSFNAVSGGQLNHLEGLASAIGGGKNHKAAGIGQLIAAEDSSEKQILHVAAVPTVSAADGSTSQQLSGGVDTQMNSRAAAQNALAAAAPSIFTAPAAVQPAANEPWWYKEAYPGGLPGLVRTLDLD